MTPTKVSYYINSASVALNILKLDEFFLPMDVGVIRGIPLCTRRQHDFWSWHFEKKGLFTIRSTYWVLATIKKSREDWLNHRSSSSASEENVWTKL
jgi:hypothetical protein